MQSIISLATEDLGTVITAADTREFVSSILAGREAEKLQRLVEAAGIERRHALGAYASLRRLGLLDERLRLHAEHAVRAGEQVARRALDDAGLTPADVDLLLVVSSTGHSVPTLDHALAAALELRCDARTFSLGGLGCSGSLRAMSLASDLLDGSAARHALVVSVELSSVWLQVAEPSPQDLLADVLFGDGAAATVIGSRAGAEMVASHSERWPRSLAARGATLTQSGYRHFASPEMPRLIRAHLRRGVEEFLGRCGVGREQLCFYVLNPADHRVISSVATTLEIDERRMQPSWSTWRNYGNTLSAGPLYVLDELRRSAPPADGDLGLAVVLGPGVSCDLVLLRWR